MKAATRSSWLWVIKKLRTQFLAGIIVGVPIGVTVLILTWIFNTVDNILQPIISLVWGAPILGVGFGATVVLIYIIGVIASNVVGKSLIHFAENLVRKIPVIGLLYTSAKEILESVSTPSKSGFLQTVLIEYPRKDIWTIAFITKELPTKNGEFQYNVFVPTTPNPATGFLQIVNESDIIRTNIPVDVAFKMIISLGKAAPAQEITDALSKETKNVLH